MSASSSSPGANPATPGASPAHAGHPFAPAVVPELPLQLVDLVGARQGGRALLTNDDFFAPLSNLIAPAPPVWEEGRYTERGKWMDGWESRRRRQPGHDWCVLQLGLVGVPRQAVIDTSFFRGNFPESCSLEGCHAPGADAEQLAATPGLWWPLLERTLLAGHNAVVLPLLGDRPVTHVRFHIYPDGGVARLRLLGEVHTPLPDLLLSPSPLDLAALALGGTILGCSDAFFSKPQNLIHPSRSAGMHDGWETKRRRGPGFDWVALDLGQPGAIARVEVDTSHFKGNAPGSCELHVSDGPVPADALASPPGTGSPWRTLLPHAPLSPHALHVFEDELLGSRRAHAVRLDIHPDGGVARLRLPGVPDAVAALNPGLARLNALPAAQARAAFLACCGAEAVADALLAGRPFASASQLVRAADAAFVASGESGWRRAFAAHPEIGERHAPAAGNERSARWSAGEQASRTALDDDTRARLAEGNRAYRERFGHVFLICATGRSPAEMLAWLERRLTHDAATELAIAAAEQRRITTLRLLKLLGESS